MFVSSRAALIGIYGLAAYCGSKYAGDSQRHSPWSYKRSITRGDPFIMFTLRGEGGYKNLQKLRTAVLIGCVKCKLRGGLKSQKFCERNKWMPPFSFCPSKMTSNKPDSTVLYEESITQDTLKGGYKGCKEN